MTLRSNEQVNEAALGPYRCKRPPEPLVLAIRVRNTNHLDTNDFDGPFEPIIPDSGAYSVLAHSAGSQTRRESSAALLDAVSQDLRYALRTCRPNPGFTLVAVLTLAVGIGANTAIFSLVNAVLLTPLPYPDPSRLVVFMTTAPEGCVPLASEVKFNAWRSLTSTFDHIAAFRFTLTNINAADHFERITVGEVSAELFALFGARTQTGRTLSAADHVWY